MYLTANLNASEFLACALQGSFEGVMGRAEISLMPSAVKSNSVSENRILAFEKSMMDVVL